MRKFGILLTIVACLAITLPGCGDKKTTDGDKGTQGTEAKSPDAGS